MVAEPIIHRSPMPTPDPKIESWIASHGSTFEFKPILLASINKRKSLDNQARFQPLNDDTVLMYAAAMERGDLFPPIVVYSDGGYVVIDGNHRVEAAELSGATEVGAYALSEVSERQVQTMTFEANTKHGLPATTEERTAHGIYLVDLGVNQKEAARLVNVPIGQLQKAVAHARADRRLASLGIERWNTLGIHVRDRLDSIRSDVVLRAAVEFAISAKPRSQTVLNMVVEANRQNSESAALAVIEDYRRRSDTVIRTTAGGRLPVPTGLTRLTRTLTYGENLVVDEVKEAMSALTFEQRRTYLTRVDVAIENFMRVKEIIKNG